MKKNKQKYYKKTSKRETASDRFLSEYAENISLDGKEYDLPDWIFDYREMQLAKISSAGKKLYAKLKDLGYDFKVKYPIQNFGKCKFADAYLPKENIVIVLMNFQETITTSYYAFDRKQFFEGKHRCIMILPEEIKNIGTQIKNKTFMSNDTTKFSRKAIKKTPHLNQRGCQVIYPD